MLRPVHYPNGAAGDTGLPVVRTVHAWPQRFVRASWGFPKGYLQRVGRDYGMLDPREAGKRIRALRAG